MIDWNIQSRAQACQACGKGFSDGQSYRTILFEERTGYMRQDVCAACWDTQYSQGSSERKGFVSQWQGLFEKAVPQPEAIQKETAETLLRKLVTRNDPQHAAACFILAVMLERKRLLKIKAQSVQDGQRVFIYEQPRTGDLFTIVDPGLQLNQLDAVQRDVGHLLEHGLEDLTPPTGSACGAPLADTQATDCPPAAVPAVPAGDAIGPELHPAVPAAAAHPAGS